MDVGQVNRVPLFVYGTLMSDQAMGALIPPTLSRSVAKVRGRLWDLPAGYPALQPGGEDFVTGELIDAPDDRVLALLDQYESDLYERREVTAHLGLRTVSAWAWVMDDPTRAGGRLLTRSRWRPIRTR